MLPQVPGFPIKLLNYMAAGRASVLFASSAGRDLVDREAALLVAPVPRVLTRITLPLLWPAIASSALLTFVLALSDYAYVLELGKVVAEGTGEELQGDKSVERAYLGITAP